MKNNYLKCVMAFGLVFLFQGLMGQKSFNHAGKAYLNNFNDKFTTVQVTGLKDAYLNYPEGICIDTNNRIYFTHMNRVMIIDGSNLIGRAGGAGDPTFTIGHNDLNGTGGRFDRPKGIAVDPNTNEVYVCDWGNNSIRKMSKYVNVSNTQLLSTYTGSSSSSNDGSTDGALASAKFRGPYDIVIMNNGDKIITDEDNHTIRKISGSTVSTLVGSAGVTGDVDGTGSAVRLSAPRGMCIKDQNTVLFTDFSNGKIKELNLTTNAVTTVVSGLFGPLDVEYINGTIYYTERTEISRVVNGTKEVWVGDKFEQDSIAGEIADTRFGELTSLVYNAKEDVVYAVDSRFGIIKKIELFEQPVVDFSANNVTPTVNQIINITDETTNKKGTPTWEITPGNYDLVNGTTLNSEVLQLKFTSTGSYQVKLTYNFVGGSAEEVKQGYINVSNVNAAPIVDFNASVEIEQPNTNITLTDLSANNPSSWAWEITPSAGVTYQNGTSATSKIPVVQFANEGDYTVKLTATNGFGTNDLTKTDYITIDKRASVSSIASAQVTVYPNPANTSINVLSNIAFTTYRIYNVQGQQVLSQTWSNESINISSLKNGVYSIVLTDKDGKSYTSRILKN